MSKPRMLIGSAVAAAITFSAIGIATPAQAAPATKYSNCTALNAKHPGGVAKSRAVKNTKTAGGKKVAAQSKHRPKVSKSLYTKNSGLDRDKDGIACER